MTASPDILLATLACTLGERSAIYLSGPVTTGPRFVDWYKAEGRAMENDPGYAGRHHAEVVVPNSEALKAKAEALRSRTGVPVIEPGSLLVHDWSQDEYVDFWRTVMERFVQRVVLSQGWEYSSGCVQEVLHAFELGLPVEDADGALLDRPAARAAIARAAEELQAAEITISYLLDIRDRILPEAGPTVAIRDESGLRKDRALDHLAERINVAQFVSFSPRPSGPKQEYARVLGLEPNHRFADLRSALSTLIERSPERSINLRSFMPGDPQSKEFIYGVTSLDRAESEARRLSGEGLHVIANETVDVNDGGVSGVVMEDVVEFAPDDTPRCVEKPGTASLPRAIAERLLRTVYGFTPDIHTRHESRLEFSIHPKARGWRHTHTLGWEYEEVEAEGLTAAPNWPNRFSRMIGDKVYGLLMAYFIGLPVPETTVVNRRLAPFSFGLPTGSNESWIRTAPTEQVPGKFTTVKGWMDPFALLQKEDPGHRGIASIVSQRAVPAEYSGAALVSREGELIIEGVRGEGDRFMQGSALPTALPETVRKQIEAVEARAGESLGPVRFEWVFDGERVWVVQMHRGATLSSRTVIVPGDASHWETFAVSDGLEALRRKLDELSTDTGLIVRGEVGLTSHVADVLRRSGVPSKIEDAAA